MKRSEERESLAPKNHEPPRTTRYFCSSNGLLCPRTRNNPNPEVVGQEVRRTPVAIRRARVASVAVVRSATHHAVFLFATTQPRATVRRCTIVSLVIPILTPLLDVP